MHIAFMHIAFMHIAFMHIAFMHIATFSVLRSQVPIEKKNCYNCENLALAYNFITISSRNKALSYLKNLL